MHCAIFGGNWTCVYSGGDLQILSMYFLLFGYYLYLEIGMALHLSKHDSTSLKDALCKVWLKLVKRFLSTLDF